MMLEEYTIENTKVKFYDDYIVENAATQKEYIDNVIINLIRKINSEEEKEMLAILDTIAEENERILQQGIRKGKIEGIKETTINNAKKMKKANIDIKLIMEITGLKKEEIERL